MAPVCFAYYCSGHGYGHATRVSAFACHLLKLSDAQCPVVLYIVSPAPQHVFTQSIAIGARYRHAEIDPVIVQPLAYCVDRGKSVRVLEAFLEKKDALLATEKQWLLDIHATAVLSDAAFLGCQAAKLAGMPSILITNFTFDSVYSYLSTTLRDDQPSAEHELIQANAASNSLDTPIPRTVLQPLIEQIHFGYRCADLLIRLPGHIPIPSFATFPSLPSSEWVDITRNRFLPEIVDHLLQPVETYSLHQPVPYPTNFNSRGAITRRFIISAPLFVRPPSSSAIYLSEGRSQLLASVGVPEHLHDSKILVVSFGGQFFRCPSRPGSRSQSPSATPSQSGRSSPMQPGGSTLSSSDCILACGRCTDGLRSPAEKPKLSDSPEFGEVNTKLASSHLVTTPLHIRIPGAPPALRVTPPTPRTQASAQFTYPPIHDNVAPSILCTSCTADVVDEEPRLLPDTSWIAIICGASKEQWIRQLEEEELDLPEQFFIAPRDVYMPDLTAVGDVLLGKLGYGTVSECVDACTPFVFVSRPLFIEEHGLRLLLEKEGVGIELSRSRYESGDWADTIEAAWRRGSDKKAKKREEGLEGESVKRQQEIRELAETVLRWTEEK